MLENSTETDPHLWLEEVNGEKALAWARERNKETLAELQADPRYQGFYDTALGILDAKDRIPYAGIYGDLVYNFWRDAEHVKGLWRRAPLAEYLKQDTAWETVLDLDKLSEEEKETWVFSGAVFLQPGNRFCLLRLSRGGKDAVLIREFDTVNKTFVEDGFKLEESKSGVCWLDKDTLLLSDALAPDSLTDSGYSRVVREWKRGTPPRSGPVLYEGLKADMMVYAMCSCRPEGTHSFVVRRPSFFEEEVRLLDGNTTVKMPLPRDADVCGVFDGRIILKLRSDWKLPGKTLSQSSVLAVSIDKAGLTEAEAAPELIFEPGPRVTVNGVSTTKNCVLLSLLDNVKGRLLKLSREGGAWKSEDVPVQANGSASVVSADDFSEDFLFSYQSFLTPESLFYSGAPGGAIKQTPPKFDASGLETDQREAVSADGTRIPYFIVYPGGMKPDGNNPVLLYGYGGFEVSLSPGYPPVTGRLWLERGGVYVVANIRGGGEFGAAWHQAALLEKRQNAYDDFIAVAEDLIKTGVTAPSRLAIKGGSNGGLLMGVMLTQRPDLFKAVLCGVPLLDMLRYTKLPPGASWAAEYGDPDSPELGPVIAKYSPYQNIRAGVNYPDIFLETSTKDDRVHPGHARKTAAKLLALGKKVYYYENMDGGHGGAANNKEAALRSALEFVLLSQKLDVPGGLTR
ncbi:MAG TPA: S9 family peptidase [Elusimicrobia bacterium]|nr:MAG: hypothetical protein A2089_05330 [Elusimicrobia bacterium GWD2_63_28]HCC48799.1 S9 family peptidase [Elusimicrobiota bacterium]